MRRVESLLIFIFLSIIPLLFLHLKALEGFWYWKYWWFDNIMHFIGGFAIALIVIFYGKKLNWIYENKVLSFLLGVAGLVLITAFVWEVFEYVSGITFLGENYFIDTTSDLAMGLLGSLVSMLLALKILKNQNGE